MQRGEQGRLSCFVATVASWLGACRHSGMVMPCSYRNTGTSFFWEEPHPLTLRGFGASSSLGKQASYSAQGHTSP